MKCPNCGQEIPEEHLYCEKCGMEIRIVPDFEPEIENSITETLSTVAEEIEEKEPEKEESSEYGKASDELFSEEPGKNKMLISFLTFLAAALIVIGTAVLIYINYSVSYQVKNARKYAQQENYEEAVKYLDKAIQLESGNAELVILQSNYYYMMGNSEKSLEILLSLIERSHLTHEEAEKAYESIISIYDEQEKYEEINELLLACTDDGIVTDFQHYMAMAPEFSYVGGSYEEVIPLKLSANTTGTIYYTMDGSTPDEHSKVYTAPVFLESGSYLVSALFINDYGIKSKVAKSWYQINLTVPEPPKVLLYSGKYEVPTMIEVEIPETGTVYYTTDGSEPNTDSLQYTEPIFMPLGRSNFKFAVISEEGVSSETVSRSYEFQMDTDITTDMAVENVMRALMKRNVLTDMQGHTQGAAGRYIFQYDTIVKIDESYYYILNEYYEEPNGGRSKTELLYAVEVYTGSPNRLIYDENGEMGLIPLSD